MKNWTCTCFRRDFFFLFFLFFLRINDREVELKWKGKALLPTKSEIRILCSKQISEAYLHCRAHNYTEHSHWLI